jgi:CubicO group peptidase (beta-lactamase class C family)
VLAVATVALWLANDAFAQVPDTPIGRVLSGWLDTINGADRASLEQWMGRHMPDRPIEDVLGIRRIAGGFDLRRVETSSPNRIVALVQERGLARQFARLTLSVAEDDPDRITDIRFERTERPAEFAPPKLTAAEVQAARDGVAYRQLTAWLDALNSGDRARLERYLLANYPSAAIDQQMAFFAQTGGFEVRALEEVAQTTLVGLVQERASDQFARFVLTVEPDAPHKITGLELGAIPRPAEFPIARVNEADAIAALRAKLAADATAERFSGAVLVGRIANGRATTLFSEAYGLADRENRIANTVDTRFRNGSMNKMFTAVAVLKLVQDGKIELTDTLGKHVTDYPNRAIADEVTIHHLLTHTGGTGDIFGPEFAANRLTLRTHDDYVALFGQRAPAFTPGSRYAYSNYGMVLLGVLIERVSGQSYYDYVAEHVYAPAGMTRTGSEPESEVVSDRSIGYVRARGAGGWTPNTDTLPHRGTAAGGGYTTVGDLLKFANALLAHELLDAAHTELLITGKVDVSLNVRYAYGFEDSRKDGVRVVGHSGGAPGMSGDLRIYPSSGYVVAALSNGIGAAPQITEYIGARLPQ